MYNKTIELFTQMTVVLISDSITQITAFTKMYIYWQYSTSIYQFNEVQNWFVTGLQVSGAAELHFYKCQVNSAHGVENIDNVMKISSSCDS